MTARETLGNKRRLPCAFTAERTRRIIPRLIVSLRMRSGYDPDFPMTAPDGTLAPARLDHDFYLCRHFCRVSDPLLLGLRLGAGVAVLTS